MDEEDLLFLAFLEEEQRTRRWVREPYLRRQEEGEYSHLNLERGNPDFFYGAYRMSPQRFDEIMSLIKPYIGKKQTNFRKPICEEERLAITLR